MSVRGLRGVLATVVLTAGWVGACAPPATQTHTASGGKDRPKLVLFLVVDQMRADYLERFRPLWRHGLARLLAEGVVFTEARHDHAVTTTAPGHATLSTGLHPSHHGIVNNSWWDEKEGERVTAVEDARDDLSPRRLLGSSLGGWMKRADPQTKVFTASVKDRGAIFLGGREADGAYWFDAEEGGFVSSSYYPEAKPQWLGAFNDLKLPAAELTRPWKAAELPAGSPSLAELGIEVLDRGLFPDGLPRVAGGSLFAPTEDFYDALSDTPWADHHLVDFALALVEGEALGQDPHTDLLGLSFSAVDLVGHSYGPNSAELLSALLNLDVELGRLLAELEARVGQENLLVSLSADHGVVPVPEYQQAHGLPGRRISGEDLLCLRRVGLGLKEQFGGRPVLNAYGNLVPEALDSMPASTLEAAARDWLRQCPHVEQVWTSSQLASPAAGQPFARLYSHSWHPDRGPDVFIQYEEGFLATRANLTSHGVPYDYDRHVPWIVRAPGRTAARCDEPVSTVDVAPTVASLVGVPVPEDRDGADRSAWIRSPVNDPPAN